MLHRLLVANRGEVALRVIRTADDLGIPTVAVFSADDPDLPHVAAADAAVALEGEGPPAYLDEAALVSAAIAEDCDAVHPGYGLLSERASFAAACQQRGLRFVGPCAGALRIFGDKHEALARAAEVGVPVLERSEALTTPAEAEAFMRALGQPIMLKATHGGGGRGLRTPARPSPTSVCASGSFLEYGQLAVAAQRRVRSIRDTVARALRTFVRRPDEPRRFVDVW